MRLVLKTEDALIILEPGFDYDLAGGVRWHYEDILALDDTARATLGITWLIEPAVPADKVSLGYVDELVDGVPTRVHTLADKPLADRKVEMLASLADVRWQRETGGMLFGMARIVTDDRAKLLSFAARTKAKEDPTYTRRWKVDPGTYIDLDATHLILLADAIEAHTGTCFDHEEQLALAITAAVDHAALDPINLDAGWPE